MIVTIRNHLELVLVLALDAQKRHHCCVPYIQGDAGGPSLVASVYRGHHGPLHAEVDTGVVEPRLAVTRTMASK
jgi:hypothetical protein